MKITTTRFGNLEIPDESIITFPEGVLGFPRFKRYVVLDHDSDDTPFKWLQAVDEPALAFVIIDPLTIVSGYKVSINEQLMKELNNVPAEDIGLICIVKIPQDNPVKMTVNLKAPIVVNIPKRIAFQVILIDDEYSLNFPVFPLEPEKKEACA